MPATTLTPEQEARVVELVQQEVARTMSMTDPDHDFTPNGQGGYTATAKGGGEQPQQPQGDAGNTFVPSIGKFLPNAMVDEQGNKEGPMAYVSRVAMLLSNGDAEKARELVNDLGALSPQGPSAGSYGFTADLASYPAAAAEFAKQIFSKPGAGNIGR